MFVVYTYTHEYTISSKTHYPIICSRVLLDMQPRLRGLGDEE